eukprot:961579-Ditylum_brightwellii.AAC.1
MQKQAKQFKSNKADGKLECSNPDKKCNYYSNQELNIIISKSTKDALNKACYHKFDSNKEEANAT